MCNSPFYPDCSGCTCPSGYPPCTCCVEHPKREDLTIIHLGADRSVQYGDYITVRGYVNGEMETTKFEVVDMEAIADLGIPPDAINLIHGENDLCLVKQDVLNKCRTEYAAKRNHHMADALAYTYAGGITPLKPSPTIQWTNNQNLLDWSDSIADTLARHLYDPDYTEPSNDHPASPPPPASKHLPSSAALHRAALIISPSPSLRADLRPGVAFDLDHPPLPPFHSRYRLR